MWRVLSYTGLYKAYVYVGIKGMLQRLIHRLLSRHHFWRQADFSEIAELYATRMLRAMAVGMISVFVAIYLIRNGYSVEFTLGYFGLYYLLRALLVWPAAHLVAGIGPKHGMLISNLLYVPSLLALAVLPEIGLGALIVAGVFQGLSVTLYDISSTVDFSKIKAIDHEGKELGFLYIMTKTGMTLSPLVGGVVASLFGPQFTIVVAAGIFIIAAAPLFFSPEPVATHQVLKLRGFKVRHIWRNLVSDVAAGVDFGASGPLWSLFIAVIVLAGSGDAVYAQVGALSSITLVSAVISARVFGLIIDKRRGDALLKISVLANSSLHLLRPFITSVPGVAALNITNEIATSGYSMPYIKGLSDTADSTRGYRITYLSLMSAALSLGAALLLGLAALCVHLSGDVTGLKLAYLLAGVLTLPIAWHGFAVYAHKVKFT